jgi:hypothetical protein
MGGGARGVCGREQPPPTATLHRTLSGPSLPGWDVMGVMGMSHAGGRDGDTTSTATTLGSVVEQGCKALAQPFSSGWLRGHPTSYYSACHGSTLLTGGVEGAHQRNVSRGLMSLRTASSRVQEVAGDDGQAPALQLLTHDQRIDDHAVRSSAFSRFPCTARRSAATRVRHAAIHTKVLVVAA